MARLHVKYNGSSYAQDNISCGTLICGSQGSTCIQNNIFMKRSHVEHIISAYLQDRTSCLVQTLDNYNFC